MQRFKQYIPLEILEIKTDKWEYPLHNHNYFEIIFIKEGIGTHTINETDYSYKPNDVFLISPEQYHTFEIDEYSEFVYLKFTELVFVNKEEMHYKNKWIQKMEYLLFNPNLIHGQVNYNKTDRSHIFNLLDIIIEEYKNYNSYNNEIILDSLSLILTLTSRSINKEDKVDTEGDNIVNKRVNDVLSYIRLNIYNKEKMRIDNLASIFNMSKNYISIFFKRQTGESIQKYILNYRMKLAENRLKKSDYTISEIAYELGFTDESHFNREFKKHHDTTPGKYRK